MEEKQAVRPSEPCSRATSVLIPATPDDPGPQPPTLFRPREAEVQDMRRERTGSEMPVQRDDCKRCRQVCSPV